MSEKRRKLRTFVIPAKSIKLFGNFKKMIDNTNLSDNEKEEVVKRYNETNKE